MLRFKSPLVSLPALSVVMMSSVAAPSHAQNAANPVAGAQPVHRADDFMDFVAINGGPIKTRVYEDGPFAGAGKTFDPQVFFDLGIRYYRMGLKYDLTLPDQPQQVLEAYRKSGARAMMMIDHNKVKPEEVVGLIKQYDPRSIAEIEGPNELNNKFPPQDLNLKYKGKTDEAAGAVYMDEVYKSLKADPATKNFPVVAFTSIFSDYRAAKGHTGFDYANMHSYQGYGVPSSSLLMNETRFNNILPPGGIIKPFVPTELGYNVEADVANGTFKTGSLRAQALNVPMLLAEYFRHGIKRAYLFAIHNADGYGLLESDLVTKRPSYYAVKNFLSAIRDAQWNPKTLRWEGGAKGNAVTPRSLMFGLEGAPSTVHTLTLQKQSGEYLLVIWNEVPNFDEGSKKDIINPPVPVTVKLQTPVAAGVQILTQNESGNYDTTTGAVKNGVLQLQVPSSVMIVRLRPGAVADRTAPAPPSNVQGSGTENSISLSWRGSAARDTVGYFVFRNGGHVATTTSTSYEERSPWLRPGLGYTYAVQAFDRAGNLSPRVAKVIQTAPKYPDLVVTNLELPTVKGGEAVRFKGTFKNIGDGATPHDVVTGISFFVDGQFTAWATTDGKPIAPGESVTLETNGGPRGTPLWTATPGAHVVRVQVDDINRVVGESNEWNNDFDRTLNVDVAGQGLLSGSSDPAPFEVNLTQEGTLDWIQWGQGGKESVVKKAGGQNNFSAMGKVGEGYRDATPGASVRLKWSDGDTVKSSDGSNAGYWLNGVGHGYEFSVGADTKERVLKVYVSGIEGARGKLVAKLSDNSAPDYVSTTWSGNATGFDWAPVPGGFSAVYTFRFRAASPNQNLKVQWILDGEPNQWLGQARLQAATLSNG